MPVVEILLSDEVLKFAPAGEFSLVDWYLGRQQEMTAVEAFSEAQALDDSSVRARRYEALLPASPPAAGEQYAFEVDLDACSGCKACVSACHSLNGLDENEAWRDVGLLIGGTAEAPALQYVTAACHHCLDPACLTCCPVRAYEKDPRTGIVRHLDDQCIGCQYCIFACPYDVPKYNRKKGIVRKCDMCSDRLASGEPPACVQACPHRAIRIRVVRKEQVLEDCEAKQFLPGAPDPHRTLPTTHYKTRQDLPRNMLPADYHSVRREHAHWPLILMLVLTQLSVGAFLVQLILQRTALDGGASFSLPVQAVAALGFGLLALGASVLHLGRPQYAFRAVLGLTTSWLSREILCFGLFAVAAALYSIAAWRIRPSPEGTGGSLAALADAVVFFGLAGVISSVMVYQCTGRDLWNGWNTSVRFLTTMALLGLGTTLLISLAAVGFDGVAGRGILAGYGRSILGGLIGIMAAKLLFEFSEFRHLWRKQNTGLKRSATLLAGELAAVTKARFICGVGGGMVLPLALVSLGRKIAQGSGLDVLMALEAGSMFAVLLAGELCERYLFFAAVVPAKMPGGPSS
jgi:Fe-S-cluster-containing dehydrogenase component